MKTLIVTSARQISLDPPQWAGVTNLGEPVYARISKEGNCASVRVAFDARADDVQAAVRSDPYVTFASPGRTYSAFRKNAAAIGCQWPETLEGESRMIPLSEFLALDELVADAIHETFLEQNMESPLTAATARILEREAESRLSEWLQENSDNGTVALCDEAGLPKMDLPLAGSPRVVIDPVEAAWVKIVW